jgi:hypothetical protein
MLFIKGGITGELITVHEEIRTSKRVRWKLVLTLVDSSGNRLYPNLTFGLAQRRKARDTIASLGWEVKED